MCSAPGMQARAASLSNLSPNEYTSQESKTSSSTVEGTTMHTSIQLCQQQELSLCALPRILHPNLRSFSSLKSRALSDLHCPIVLTRQPNCWAQKFIAGVSPYREMVHLPGRCLSHRGIAILSHLPCCRSQLSTSPYQLTVCYMLTKRAS